MAIGASNKGAAKPAVNPAVAKVDPTKVVTPGKINLVGGKKPGK